LNIAIVLQKGSDRDHPTALIWINLAKGFLTKVISKCAERRRMRFSELLEHQYAPASS
jgi:hypothetical protein